MASIEQVQYHYDVDNNFYSKFLDKKYMVYSCGVWKTATDLESAQVAKLNRILRYAGVRPNHRLLDVGCGWGGLMRHATETGKVKHAHGITVSRDQYDFVSRLHGEKFTIQLMPWESHTVERSERYDSIASIGAFEHFASLEDRSKNLHRAVYRKFFEWAHSVSTESACIGLQTIITKREPMSLGEVRDTRFLLENIFPGSALPTLSDIQASSADLYEFSECKTIGADYSRTLQCWKDRLQSHKDQIVETYGENLFQHYDKYFSCSINNFNAGVADLLQVSLRKVVRGKSHIFLSNVRNKKPA